MPGAPGNAGQTGVAQSQDTGTGARVFGSLDYEHAALLGIGIGAALLF